MKKLIGLALLLAGITFAQTAQTRSALISLSASTLPALDGGGTVTVSKTFAANRIGVALGFTFSPRNACSAVDTSTPTLFVYCEVTSSSWIYNLTLITLTGYALETGTPTNFTAGDKVTWQMGFGH